LVGHPGGLFCLASRSTETLAEEGAMLSVVDWLLGWLSSKGVDVSGNSGFFPPSHPFVL